MRGVRRTFSMTVHVEPAGHFVSRMAQKGLENVDDELL